MFGRCRSSSDASEAKVAQIDAIMDDLVLRHEAGGPVDAADIERAHSELMPQLGERLRALRAIQEASRRALQPVRQLWSPGPRDAWLDEDLEFLRRSLDHYDVLERVRYGGQGVVYKGRQKGANRLVAIKVLLDGPLASDRQRYRFEREIELISRLRHPNIVTLYEAGVVRGRHYFAMEFVNGLPVDDYVLLHDLTPREIVRLFIKVCRAVSYAHQNGVIHRDLSPANILVDEQGQPHIFDFGLAKDVWASDDAHGYSFTGQVIGTLQYLSPEQAGGLDRKVDARSDIYTLGVVLYELLTDGFPYPTEGEPQQVCDAILNTRPEPLRRATARAGADRIRGVDAINRDLETILAKGLAKEKEERYQSAAAFAEDLERCLAGDPVAARGDSPLYLLRKMIRRYRVPVAVAAIMLLTFCASAIAITASWVQARIERDNAREAARVAYDLFDTAVTDLDTAVRPLAGGVAVRDRMIAGLADRLPRLEALIESDEALDAISTRLAERRGDLAHKQGAHAEAARHYRAFLEGSRRLAELEPANRTDLDSLLRAYRKYARVCDDPAPLYEAGIRFAEEVVGDNPEHAGARYQLATLHVAFGQHLLRSEQYTRALEHFDFVLSSGPGESSAAEDRWDQLVAMTKDARGRILLQLGDGAAGLAELAASLRIRERIVEARPADTISRYELMVSCAELAVARRDADRLNDAKQLLEKAVAHGELLRTMDPTVTTWGFFLYGALDRLARIHLDTGELTQAHVHCDRACTLAEELARACGTAPDGLSTLAFAYVLRGRVLLAGEKPDQAHAAFEKAADIRESLLERDASNLPLLESLAVAHSWLAKSARRMGQSEEAGEHYQAARAIRGVLYERQPHVIERALNLIQSQTNLAVAYMDCDTETDDFEAARLLEDAERLLESLRASGSLVGLERKYQIWTDAIRANQTIIRGRMERRNDTSDGASDGPRQR